jgi:competence protein ComFC
MRNLPPYISRVSSHVSRIYTAIRTSFFALCFPSECVLCSQLQKYPEVLCEGCQERLPWIRAPRCKLCGTPFPEQWRVEICPDCRLRRPGLTRLRSVFLYETAVMQMIRQVKFSRQARPLHYFAELLNLQILQEFPRKIAALVPVPLHRSREWERTFNQSALLARYISQLSGIPALNLLRRIKRTPPQTSLSGQARRRNLHGAFQMKGKVKVPRSVILLDDVVTTGATLESCAAVLRKAGVHRVYGLTIARAVLKV